MQLPKHLCRLSVLMLLCGVLTVPAAWGQAQPQPSLDDLQRQIEQARRDQEARARQRQDATGARTAGTRQATLVIEADAPCELRLDGQRRANLAAQEATTVIVEAGEQLIDCISSQMPDVRVRQVLEAKAGSRAVLLLPMAQALAEEQGRRRAAQEAQARARAEAAARAREQDQAEARARAEAELRAACGGNGPSTMLATGDAGVLRQCGTGLLWTRSDSGRDVNWAQAQAHCRGMGQGWSLPTVEQLQSLFDQSLPVVACGSGFSCRVSGQFRLSGFWAWSSQPNGSSEAWFANLRDSDRHSVLVGGSNFYRALCVRRS